MAITEIELRRAQERLSTAGVPEEQAAPLAERAAALIRGLEELAALDAELPEPALTWRPVTEVTT